jgi:hypothetical protein
MSLPAFKPSKRPFSQPCGYVEWRSSVMLMYVPRGFPSARKVRGVEFLKVCVLKKFANKLCLLNAFIGKFSRPMPLHDAASVLHRLPVPHDVELHGVRIVTIPRV